MSHEVKAITIKKPVILNKNKIILKKDLLPFKGNVKVLKSIPLQEDVLYETKQGDFLSGDAREIVIVNRLNKRNNSCRTIAKCKSHSGQVFEKTSDEVTRIIGQSNYDTLLSALCSVISQELKIRGIYSLLTVPKVTKTVNCQADDEKKKLDSTDNKIVKPTCNLVDAQSQTEETSIAMYKSTKIKRRNKRSKPAPYVIREPPVKRVVIPPCNFSLLLKDTNDIKEESPKEESTFPEWKGAVFDDDSNHSVGKLSAISVATIPELLNNPMSMIDRVTQSDQKDTRTLHNFDSGKIINVNDKPALSNQVLQNMPRQQRIQMLLQQGIYDFQHCMQRDESDHLPIHVAVLQNDLDLLKRQCLVLKMKGISVDITADNLTPLKMSLYQENVAMTSLLLQFNADVLDSDAQDRTYFHIAAEMDTDHLKVLLYHCQQNARKLLEENESLWVPAYATKTDTELATILLTHVSKLTNDQGYTPLMMACKLGLQGNVRLLVESASETVNFKMPSSGNTALYLAAGAACMDSIERGNRSLVVDHFKRTIEILVENGADPHIKNFDGANVNDLLMENNIADLSMLIANKMTCRNLGDSKIPAVSTCEAFMLIKDQDGNVDIQKVEKKGTKKTKGRVAKTPKKTPVTPRIVYPPTATGPKKPLILRNNKSLVGNIAKFPNISNSKAEKNSPNKPIIIKSETFTGDFAKNSIQSIPGILNNMSKIQNFKLNKPLILKSVPSKDKRQLEITYEPNEKRTND